MGIGADEQRQLAMTCGGAHRTASGPVCAAFVSAMLIVFPVSVKAQQSSDALSSEAASTTRITVYLPLLLDGRYIADVGVQIPAEGGPRVQLLREDVERALGTRLADDILMQLLATDRDYLLVSDFEDAGLTAVYDAAALEVRVAFPTSAARPGTISLFGDNTGLADGPPVEPARFSGSLILTATQGVDYERPGSSLEPLRGFAEASIAIGGEDGIFLFSDILYDGSANNRFSRGQTVAIHDDRARAIRYSAGDLLPQAEGFQGAPLLGGIGIERTYQELQPNRNVRPAGLFRFALEQPSVVEIAVNGSPVRVLQLDRGQYDIRDFNFVTGLNEVEIYARDDFGRRVIARFSQFFDFDLLAEGIAEFGFYAGGRQETGSNNRIRYDFDNPVVSGFFRKGVTSNLTFGANAQAQHGHYMIGATAIMALPVGSFAVVSGFSGNRATGSGHRVLASFQKNGDRLGFVQAPTLNLEVGHTSSAFMPVGNLGLMNDVKFDLRARMGGSVGDTNFSFSGTYATRRNDLPDSYLIGLTGSRQLGSFSLTATAEHGRTGNGQRESRALLSIGMRFGRRGNARASYDTRRDLTQLNFSRFSNDTLDDWSARGTFSHDRDGVAGVAEATYNHNRAFVSVEHSSAGERDFGNLRSRTSFSASTQISFAGDRIGFGRPVGPNFVLAYPHETLRSRVEVSQGVELERVQARSGSLGPALADAGTPYTKRRLTVRAPEASLGYDTGPGYYTMRPPAASGYSIQVGSAASYSASGRLLDVTGEPVSLLAGSARSLDDPNAKAVTFFTNRTGRFVITGLAPGRYRLNLGRGAFYADISVTPEAETTIDLGLVTLLEKDDQE